MDKTIILEVFEEFEENKRELNVEQVEFLREHYNSRMKFEYAEGHLCFMFKGKKGQIHKLKHYAGFEYEEDKLETVIQHDDEVFLVYGMSDRVSNFVDKLQKLESNE